jgi:hypothetical protein
MASECGRFDDRLDADGGILIETVGISVTKG